MKIKDDPYLKYIFKYLLIEENEIFLEILALKVNKIQLNQKTGYCLKGILLSFTDK